MKQLYPSPTVLTSPAYLLITHGSGDYRSQLALEHLTRLIRMQIESQPDEISYPIVNTATLEFNSVPLHQQILQFAQDALALGSQELQLLPLFLLPGVHVTEDLPRAIAIAQTLIGKKISITQLPCLGTNIDLVKLWQNRLTTIKADAKILISHGTRRLDGNRVVEATAQQLGALTAYCSVSPSLYNRVTMLAKAGCKSIAILPHVLFKGAITDAIASQVTKLQQQLPQVELILEQPLGATVDLAQFIADRIKLA
ncbi:putative Sirohydrochlorin cobaltochelatase [Hyella patelloides LEGE 07179]|uniref:Putative Sirohydrochlorin cobaltochelatase n=1 Tax=Hyella patelloides LEGE 07179 TaxID=945734 RepID=A0A563VQ01_9CYAN|nr:CbiX/SirB N-terminal domain-containing protein [Hyella patelloides]VEP13542.1 putative Sirohydrochlorin cobaltochelatase [Hyella patelloides LEGE 07179]